MRNRPVTIISEQDKAYVESLIIHADDEVLVFNKPSGLSVQTRGNQGQNLDHLLWAFAKSNGKRPRLVHRLDTGTSGVIIAAKTHPSAVNLSAQFEQRTASKTYFAVVQWDGRSQTSGFIDAPLATLADRPPKAIVSRQGKSAQTEWVVLRQSAETALLEVRPRTGRMHQIRAHLAHTGAPIYGDAVYGGPNNGRLMLHAASLGVLSISGEARAYNAPPGEDWVSTLCDLGLN